MLNIFMKGGPVMYPLLACSIIVLTVIIERIFFWIGMDMHRNKPLVDAIVAGKEGEDMLFRIHRPAHSQWCYSGG